MDGIPTPKKQTRGRRPAATTAGADPVARETARAVASGVREIMKAFVAQVKQDPEELRYWGRRLMDSTVLAGVDVDQLEILSALREDPDFRRRYREDLLDQRELERVREFQEMQRKAAEQRPNPDRRPRDWEDDIIRRVVDDRLRGRSPLEQLFDGLGKELAADSAVNGPITQLIQALTPAFLARMGIGPGALPQATPPPVVPPPAPAPTAPAGPAGNPDAGVAVPAPDAVPFSWAPLMSRRPRHRAPRPDISPASPP